MSYFIEFAVDPSEGFYQEFVITDLNTNQLLDIDGTDLRWNLYGARLDYGCWGEAAQTIASFANGLITIPAKGIAAVSIPPSALVGTTDVDTGVWTGGFDRRRVSLRYKFLAVSALGKPSVQASGTMSLGDRLMASPRIKLSVYPTFPAAQPVPTVQVSQIKQQLAKVAGQYDTVEAALPASPLDPARILWDSGGPVSLGSPLSNVVASALGFDSVAMSIFLTAAAAVPV